MIEAAVSTNIKDFLGALGRLADWAEAVPSGSSAAPPAELVSQFQKLMEVPQLDGSEQIKVSTVESKTGFSEPESILRNSDFFKVQDTSQVSVSSSMPVGEQIDSLTRAQRVNLDRGMDTIERNYNTSVRNDVEQVQETLKDITEILQKKSLDLSPLDLLQLQRFMGFVKIQAESGQKLSQGISETVEQVLDHQG